MKSHDLLALLAPAGFVVFALIVAGLCKLSQLADAFQQGKAHVPIGTRRLLTVTNGQLTIALAVVTIAIGLLVIARE